MKRCLYQVLMLAILLAVGLSSAKAGDEHEKKAKELPKLLGSTNTGTDFWMTFLPAWPLPGGINNIKIYVSSGVETEVVVEVKSEGWIKVKKTKPNDIIEFVLPVTIAQPYYKIDRDPTPPEKVYRQHAVHVYSKDPIICYGVTRYQYTSDGFLAIPTSGLGKEYQVASFSDVGDNGTSFGQYLPSLTGIVAPYDGTKVVFTLGGNLITQTSGGIKQGKSKSFTLNKGDVLPIGSFGKSADLSGSTIIASKPVGVISGNFCAYIPETVAACDHIVEMELPVNTWGKAYHVTKIFGRQKNSLIKVFAAKPNTKIYRDGKHIYTIQTPGGEEGKGWMFNRVAEGGPQSYIISADGPISVTQHNPGQQDDNISSDPFQLVLTPIEQFQTEITFNTPGIGDGSGFARNYVNLVFQLDDKREMPLDLEWATVENGEFEWESIGSRFGFFFESFAFDVDGKAFGMKTIALPRDGVYKIRAKLPFAAYAYGFSDYDSYGFPTSVALGDLTKPDTVAPVTTFEETCEGCYKNITVTDLPEDPDIRSNLAEIYMDSKESYNYDFSWKEFVAGEDASTTWNACPVDKSQDARAVIYFKDRRGNTFIDTLIYKAFRVTITPQPLVDFGSMRVGDTKTMDVTVTNNSPDNPVTIDKLEFASSVGFSVPAGTIPFDLPAGGSKVIQVTFTATTPSLDVNPKDNRPDPFMTDMVLGNDCGETSRKLTAIVAEPIIEVGDALFTTAQSVGRSSDKTVQILNDGTSDLIITGATGPALSVFTVKSGLSSYPITIAPKATHSFVVSFKPDAVAHYDDEIVFENNAGTNRDNVCKLSGSGIAPGLDVTGYEWERLRVDLGAEGVGEVTVTNNATESVRITEVVLGGNTVDFEVVNKDAVIGDLAPNQSKSIEVKFHPQEIGPREQTITFKTSSVGERVSTLKGIGVYARVTTTDYDFGTVDIPGGTPTTKDVEFIVDNEVYSDPIEITGLQRVQTDDGFFSYNIATQFFRGDGSLVASFPFTADKGEILTLRNVTFTPTMDGPHSRSMKILTVDDTHPHATYNTPVISVWNGKGNLIPTGVGRVESDTLDFLTICTEDSKTMDLKFGNPAVDAGIDVYSIAIEPASTNFTLSGVPSLPLNLPANSDRAFTLSVIYTPSGVGSHSANVVFKDENGTVLKTAKLEGKATEYLTKLKLSSTAQEKMVPGKPFTVTVSNPNNIDALANVQSITLKLTYDGTVAKDGNVTAGADYTVSDIKHDFNTVTFTLMPKTPGTLPSGAMAVVDFTSFLAGKKASDITLTVEELNAQCLTVDGNQMDISVGNICVLSLRAISTTGQKFQIGQNYPNPSSNQTTIDLSVAFEVPTKLTLYNSMGEVVDVLLNEQIPAGSYQIDLSTNNLPSGTYFYRIEAGPFVETHQMVISK